MLEPPVEDIEVARSVPLPVDSDEMSDHEKCPFENCDATFNSNRHRRDEHALVEGLARQFPGMENEAMPQGRHGLGSPALLPQRENGPIPETNAGELGRGHHPRGAEVAHGRCIEPVHTTV